VDVVHTHHSHDHWLGWWGRGGAALVRSFHNERAVRTGWPDTMLYRRSDGLIAVSRHIEQRLRGAGIPHERLRRVDGVVDVARFAADPAGAAKIREEFSVGGALLIGLRISSRRESRPRDAHRGLPAHSRRAPRGPAPSRGQG
jgi:hypothetical protein